MTNRPSCDIIIVKDRATLKIPPDGLSFRQAEAIFTDDSLAEFKEVALYVVERSGPESGYIKLAEGVATLRVAVSANREPFERLLAAVPNGQAQ